MLVHNPREINSNQLLHLGMQSSQSSLKAIIVHWTSGRYDQADNDYHINIDGSGKIYQTCYKLHELKNHVKCRCASSIGIALECGYDSAFKDLGHIYYGAFPPTLEQVESAAKAIAILCLTLGMTISAKTVKTHFEFAVENGYGPCSGDPEKRWDLARVPDKANISGCVYGGAVFRARALKYYNELMERRKAREPALKAPRETEFVQTQLFNA